MRAPSKYVTTLVIQGYYDGKWEDESAEGLATVKEDRAGARENMQLYRENSRHPARLIRRRVLRTDYDAGTF